MVLRRITVDISVRYIPISEKTKKTQIINQKKKQKLVHFLVNKTKKFHKTIKTFAKR